MSSSKCLSFNISEKRTGIKMFNTKKKTSVISTITMAAIERMALLKEDFTSFNCKRHKFYKFRK